MIIYASESGEVCAVDPYSGKKVWNYYVSDFAGYKPGDNRNIFKVRSYFTNTVSFYTKPKLVDLNEDGTKDLVYLTYDSKVYAISGRDGQLLWLFDSPHYLGYNLIQSGSEKNPYFSAWQGFGTDGSNSESVLLTLDKNGKMVSNVGMNDLDYYGGLNSYVAKDGKVVIATPNYIYFLRNGKVEQRFSHDLTYKRGSVVDGNGSIYDSDFMEGRNTRDAVLGSAEFSYKGHTRCAIIMNQSDGAFREHGFIEIISLDTGEVIDRLTLPYSSEFPPQILDVNKDGRLDLLINCYDGFTYCYDMKTAAP
jgi:outer membrane protein assembly factor BamB